MAVSGLPEACASHAKCIANLALDIMDLSKNVKTEEVEQIVSNNIILSSLLILSVNKYKKNIIFCLYLILANHYWHSLW